MKLDLDNYVPGLLLWVSNKVASSASQLYSARFGIGVTDWRVLAYFVVYPWSTASRACELMGLDKAAVSRSVNFLNESGWLQSRPSGLRKVEYATTAEGKRLYARIYKYAIERQEALLTGFSDIERKTLIEYLHRLLDNLDAVAKVGQESTIKKI